MRFISFIASLHFFLFFSFQARASWQDDYTRIQDGEFQQGFFCEGSGAENVTMVLAKNGEGFLYDREGVTYPLSHRTKNDQLVVEVPSLQFEQTSLYVESAQGLIVGIRFSAVYCYPISHSQNPQFHTDIWIDCGDEPGSYVPDLGYRTNLFVLSRRQDWFDEETPVVPGGSFWRRNLESRDDTNATYQFGIYHLDGRNLSIYFGGAEEHRLFRGIFSEDFSRVRILELGALGGEGQWCQVAS